MQAEEALRWVEILAFAQPAQSREALRYRQERLNAWLAAAGAAHGADGSERYDASGALILRSGKELRAWLARDAGYTERELTTPIERPSAAGLRRQARERAAARAREMAPNGQ